MKTDDVLCTKILDKDLTSAVLSGESSCEAPLVAVQGAEVEELYLEKVTRLRPLHFDGAGEVVDLREVDILDVVRAVVVLDLSPRPVDAFHAKLFALLDLGNWRDIGMPAIVQGALLIPRGALGIDGNQSLRHDGQLSIWSVC